MERIAAPVNPAHAIAANTTAAKAEVRFATRITGSSDIFGGGCSLETGQTIRPGDVIELEVEKIGTLRNRVLAPHIAG